MGKTKILNEIQEQIKNNFDEELHKLRQEMNSRQKQLRNQMENLKGEAERAMKERNEANEELKRMKELLDKKREQDGYQMKLASAINRYAPPGQEDKFQPERKPASRGGVNMNNYEKMFFDKGNNINMAGKSLKADSAMVPVDNNPNLANYFYKGTIKSQEETFKADKNGIPIIERTPGQLKKTSGIEMNEDNPYTNVEIPTLDSGIKNQLKRDRVKYAYNPPSEEKSIKADDTLDFINKINGVGANNSPDTDRKPFGRQDSLAQKANEIKNGKLNDTGFTVNTNNLAEKLDKDFPAIPAYEGIQPRYMDSQGKINMNDTSMNNAEPLNNSIMTDKSPFKLSKMGGMGVRDSNNSIGNGTMNTLQTINSINLEKINNRNEDRLADIENKYNIGGDDDSLSVLLRKNQNDISQDAIRLDTNTNFMKNENEEHLRSIKEEKWEETFKKHL